MKYSKLFLLALTLVFVQFSCNKDEAEDTPPAPTKVSVTEGKTIIEDSAVDLLGKAENFRSDDAVSELQELSDYLDQNMTTSKSMSSYPVFNYFLGLGEAVSSGKMDVKDLAEGQTRAMNTDELYADYTQETGVYVWNATLGDFEKTAESSDIDYSITYVVNGVTKTATFVVSNFQTQYVGEDYVVKSVNVSFMIGTTEYLSYSLASEYSNYLPTSISSNLMFGTLTSSVTLSNTGNTSLTTETSISLDNTLLLNYTASASGDFTMIDNGEEVPEEDFPTILSTASSELTLLNLVLSASVQASAYNTWMNENPEATMEEVATALNANAEIRVSTTNNQIIAGAEFYVGTYENTYWEYDSTTQQEVEVTTTEEEIDIRFVFDDGTSSDFETYFGEGFQSVEDQFDIIYGDYETLVPTNL